MERSGGPQNSVAAAGLSLDARHLLMYLSQHRSDLYSYVARRETDCRGWVVIPSRSFNWDPRVQTPTVSHPECLQELADYGLLLFDAVDQIYSLSPEGKRRGLELLRDKQ